MCLITSLRQWPRTNDMILDMYMYLYNKTVLTLLHVWCMSILIVVFFHILTFIFDSHIDWLRSASGLKSASTDIIISNHGPIYLRYSQISVLSKFSVLWPIYWLVLGHMSVNSLDIDLRKWEMPIDLRIGCRLWNLKKGHSHRSEVQMSVT